MTTPSDTQTELRQKIKFEILVPLVSGQVAKHQREKGRLTKDSSHEAFNHSVDEIIALVTQAEKRVRDVAYKAGHNTGFKAGQANVRINELPKVILEARMDELKRHKGQMWSLSYEERLAELQKLKEGKS